MILRYPKYYEKFQCIAGQCEDTCCAGWEIDIDDESYEYYMSLEGEFGERVRNSIKEYEAGEEDIYECHGFILKEGKRCPFLNENNLCEMILNLGEESICYVCTHTPRNYLEYGNAREISISPSCAEAGRLIFGSDKKVTFVEKEIEETLDFEESAEELAQSAIIKEIRDIAIRLLQDRAFGIEERLAFLLCYGRDIQDRMNEGDWETLKGYVKNDYSTTVEQLKEKCMEAERERPNAFSRYESFEKRFFSFEGLESINMEWDEAMEQIRNDFIDADDREKERKYEDGMKRLQRYIHEQNREYEYEQFAVYNAFLFLSRCVDDLNFWSKVQYVVVGYLMLRDMDLQRFCKNGNQFTQKDRVDVARIYAKQIEHSQENLEYLEEEFLFEEVFTKKELYWQVMGGCDEATGSVE